MTGMTNVVVYAGPSPHTLDAGSLHQEPGQGVSGTCGGVPVAVGVEAWVQRQMDSMGASTSGRPAQDQAPRRNRDASGSVAESQAAVSQARYTATHTCTQVLHHLLPLLGHLQACFCCKWG